MLGKVTSAEVGKITQNGQSGEHWAKADLPAELFLLSHDSWWLRSRSSSELSAQLFLPFGMKT
jgi:hypothetical protein